jgi:uncharacterized membrane protein YphA (DoxX/SURF4 family)
MKPKDVVILLLRLGVGAVLIYSGASKAVAPSAEFAAALEAYKLLPVSVIPVIAMTWPWLELLVGTYLFFGYFTRLFAKVAAGLFCVFLIVLGSAIARGINPGSCGCFGAGLSFSIHQTALLDSVLLVASLIVSFFTPLSPRFSADRWINSEPTVK